MVWEKQGSFYRGEREIAEGLLPPEVKQTPKLSLMTSLNMMPLNWWDAGQARLATGYLQRYLLG